MRTGNQLPQECRSAPPSQWHTPSLLAWPSSHSPVGEVERVVDWLTGLLPLLRNRAKEREEHGRRGTHLPSCLGQVLLAGCLRASPGLPARVPAQPGSEQTPGKKAVLRVAFSAWRSPATPSVCTRGPQARGPHWCCRACSGLPSLCGTVQCPFLHTMSCPCWCHPRLPTEAPGSPCCTYWG